MVIRMPYGGGVRALEHHSESEEQFYAHIPGLKMVIPSGPRTARALLVSAIRDPDPVVFFEHKALYHASKEEVPDESETMPSQDRSRARGEADATPTARCAARGARVAETLQAEDGVAPEVIDLLTISPLTARLWRPPSQRPGAVVHEAPRAGPGAEIAAASGRPGRGADTPGRVTTPFLASPAEGERAQMSH
jgi:pyruvate dehydrogenase E1 component beta subunit